MYSIIQISSRSAKKLISSVTWHGNTTNK